MIKIKKEDMPASQVYIKRTRNNHYWIYTNNRMIINNELKGSDGRMIEFPTEEEALEFYYDNIDGKEEYNAVLCSD